MVDDARVEGQAGAAAPEPSDGDEAEQTDGKIAVDPAQLAAFEAMVAGNHDEMARVAFVVSEAPGPAQDAVRAAWALAWRALTGPTPPPVDRRRDWLLGLAATEARSLFEGGYRPQDSASDSGVAATQASAARAYKSDELELANALAALDGHDRMIVGLRYVGGLDAEAIARELGMPERAVLARVARILKSLLGEERLADMPSENVADYEGALAQRVRSLTSRALVALDPGEVAQSAIDTAPAATTADLLRERLRELLERAREVDRRVWAALAGVAVFLVVATRLVGGSGGSPVVTAIPTDATRLCQAAELAAQITNWTNASGDWTATVDMRNTSAGACLVDSSSEPWLVDHNRTPLLIGKDLASALVRIGPGDVMRTTVQVHDYCGPTPPTPVTIAFRDGTLFIVADPWSGDPSSGVPSCTGDTKFIAMQPWALAQ